MEKIKFVDETTNEEILFEVLDEVILGDNKYVLVADEEDEATILKQTGEMQEQTIYSLIEDEEEFKKVAVELMSREDFDIEF